MSTTRKSSRNVRSQYNSDDPEKITKTKPKKLKTRVEDLQWSVNQKHRLLSAMAKHGCNNINGISKEFPEFTKTTVKTMVTLMIRKSKEDQSNAIPLNSLKGWKNTSLYSNKKPIITKILKYISMFEKRPPIDDCANCDFSVLYKVLSDATVGKPSAIESFFTYETFWHTVTNVEKDILSCDQVEVRKLIRQNVEKQRQTELQRLY